MSGVEIRQEGRVELAHDCDCEYCDRPDDAEVKHVRWTASCCSFRRSSYKRSEAVAALVEHLRSDHGIAKVSTMVSRKAAVCPTCDGNYSGFAAIRDDCPDCENGIVHLDDPVDVADALAEHQRIEAARAQAEARKAELASA